MLLHNGADNEGQNLTYFVFTPNIKLKTMVNPASYCYVTDLYVIWEISDAEMAHCLQNKWGQPRNITVTVNRYVEILHLFGMDCWFESTKDAK